MESRLIYSAANARAINLEWQKEGENEWIYIGINNELKKEFLLQKIKETFDDKSIFIVLGRTNSKEVNSENIEQEIMPIIGKENFLLCNKSFLTFIEFNSIGVIRIGRGKHPVKQV